MDYCLPCFGWSRTTSNELDPLLPKHSQRQTNGSASERPTVEKFVDVLAALNAGKLPTQDQFTRCFQLLLKSELLKENSGKIVTGNGPTSNQGRKVIRDVRMLVQALLQFGMEKNVDDKFQELYFQISKIKSPPLDVEVNVDIHKPAVFKAGQTAIDQTKEGIKNVLDEVPSPEQLDFDATTIIYSLRTLFQAFITSPVFRLVIFDIVSIARDVVIHTAIDVERAAGQVQHVAEEVEEQARDGIDVIEKEDGAGEVVINTSVENVRKKGKETVETIAEGVRDVKAEWKGVGEEVSDRTKEKILERTQQVVSRIQTDEASRSAMRSILILARKYADVLASASETATAAVLEVATETRNTLNAEPDEHVYPPHPYGQPQEKKPLIDVATAEMLQDVKDVLQRLGKGQSLDGLVSALGRVVKDVNEVPSVLSNEINKTIDEKAQEMSGEGQSNEKGSENPFDSPDDKNAGGNPLQAYFSRFGQYLDQALDEPGWAMSKNGARTLEDLFDEGTKLFTVVGESTVEVGQQLVAEDIDGPSPVSPPSGTLKGSSDEDIRRQFKHDLKSLVDEVEGYVSAVQHDKTTMTVVRALELLGDDLSSLLYQGSKKGTRNVAQSVAGMRGWTDWLGWALPRLLRMLPSSAIPIPSIEVKSGPIEVALYALFVQGLARGKGVGAGEPVKTSLIPDEVLVKEWTEVKIDMVDHDHEDDSSPSSSGPASTSSTPGVQTTSRIRMHMDGVRAKVEGMSYYFKYASGYFLGYEDEGLLSVDVGMGSPHDGLGVDIEVEIENESTPFESAALHVPEIVVVESELEDADRSANWDVQQVVAAPGSPPVGGARTSTALVAVGDAEPLFKVIDVQVAMRGLHISIDRSRHWILNKLLLQPLAGPVVARLMTQVLQEKARVGLEVLAKGLGVVRQDAKRKGEIRRAERRRRRAAAMKRYSAVRLEEDDEGDESLSDILPDWYAALLESGPALLGYDINTPEPPEEEGDAAMEGYDVETTANVGATLKGVIYTTKTTTSAAANGNTDEQQQPPAQPPMVYRKSTGSMEQADVDLDGEDSNAREVVDEQETIVAVGGGAQLFPGKGGPYGETDEERQGLLDSMKDGVKEAVNGATKGVHEGAEVADRVEERWKERRREEKKSKNTWKSNAFDF